MKLLRPIDSVLLLSTATFASSCAILKFGGMGPCGPSSSLGGLALLGAPIGFIGMIIGLILSIVFVRRAHNKEHVDDQHG
jgi:hypothetical protein